MRRTPTRWIDTNSTARYLDPNEGDYFSSSSSVETDIEKHKHMIDEGCRRMRRLATAGRIRKHTPDTPDKKPQKTTRWMTIFLYPKNVFTGVCFLVRRLATLEPPSSGRHRADPLYRPKSREKPRARRYVANHDIISPRHVYKHTPRENRQG